MREGENIVLHELGHAVDFVAGYVSASEEWMEHLQSSRVGVYAGVSAVRIVV